MQLDEGESGDGAGMEGGIGDHEPGVADFDRRRQAKAILNGVAYLKGDGPTWKALDALPRLR